MFIYHESKRRMTHRYRAMLVMVCCLLIGLQRMNIGSEFPGEVMMVCAKDRPIRVAMLDYPNYLTYDEQGKPYGYAVEYLDRIADYTGWRYEYVTMTFAEAMVALENNQIDLVPGMQRNAERAERFCFSEDSMGFGGSVIVTLPEDDRFAYNDYANYGGMRVACMRGSLRMAQTQEKLDDYGVTVDFVEYDDDAGAKQALREGKVDTILMSGIRCEAEYKIVARIDKVPMYFGVNPHNESLRAELDNAMEELHLRDSFLELRLEEKYYGEIMNSMSFTAEEQAYIDRCGPIKVACISNRIPYVGVKDGVPEGVCIDVMEMISQLSGLQFEYEPVDEGVRVYSVLSNMDCDLYLGMSNSDITQLSEDLTVSDSYMQSTIYMVGRDGECPDREQEVTFAFPATYQVNNLFLKQFPYAGIRSYDSMEDCLLAIRNQEADFTCMNEARASLLLQNPNYNGITVLDAYSYLEDFSIAMLSDDASHRMLMRILNKCIGQLNSARIADSLMIHMLKNTYHMTAKDMFMVYRSQFVVGGIAILLVLFLLFAWVRAILRSNRRHKDDNTKLHETMDQLNSASEAKSRFLACMSHEIRTPMNAIVGYSKLGKELTGDVALTDREAKMKDYLQKIDTSAEYLLQIMNEVLDMAKIEQGTMQLMEEDFSFHKLVQTIGTLVDQMISGKNIRYTEDIDPKLLREDGEWILHGDKVKLQQIFLNLLSNACKYTPAGGSIILRIQTSDNDNDVMMNVSVADTGIGISEDFMPHIFESFAREYNGVTSEYGGTGLGLAVCKKNIELMGGSIRAESKKGEGTTFFFSLKLTKVRFEKKDMGNCAENNVENCAKICASTAVAAENRTYRPGCVLVVEDHPLNQEIVKQLLLHKGYEVRLAENGQIALELFEVSQPNEYAAILMDIRMPIMDGLTAARKIRALNRADATQIPIIAMSANAFEEDVRKSLAAGMNAHIAKPIDPALLFSEMNRFLA